MLKKTNNFMNSANDHLYLQIKSTHLSSQTIYILVKYSQSRSKVIDFTPEIESDNVQKEI